jgi:hypothetical protein
MTPTRSPRPTCANAAAEIVRKCMQYWNEPSICPEEVHAILEYIHERARHIQDIADGEDYTPPPGHWTEP